MKLIVNDQYVMLVILVTFLASALLIPIVRRIAFHIKAIDMPDARRVNQKPMPTLGGLAIFLSYLLGYMLYGRSSIMMLSILIGGFLIVLIGMIDDINPVKARYKFLVQIMAAFIVVFYGGMVLNNIAMFGINLVFPSPLNYLVTIVFIIAITNSINLIDGLDGLAGGVSSIYFLTIAVIAFIFNKSSGLDLILTLIMLGSTLGFLLHNFNPATIYMGDTGSLFLGFMISVIALLGFKTATLTSLLIPILILAIPIADTLLAILRRLLKGESIGTPDKEHLHHQLLKMKFSTRKTVLIIYGINILFAAVSILYVLGHGQIAIFLYVVLMIALIFLVMKTDILFNHHKDR